MTAPVHFLFLGETLLIPHLYPVVEALAKRRPRLPIDIWVATSVHERLLGDWLGRFGPHAARIRRAPGFRRLEIADGHNPPLPPKIPTLLRLAPRLRGASVVVCVEQTSLWLPVVLPMRARFIKLLHGAGSMMSRDDRRRKVPWRTLVPSERERDALIRHGVAADRIRVIGYAKASFVHNRAGEVIGRDGGRPTVLYTPHWQRHRSSWWAMGPQVLERLIAAGRYRIIFAPHQRLIEKAPDVAEVAAALADVPNVHCDLGSFAGVDGSYTRAADIYLGDTSSQVVEFLMTPRPCLFLDPARTVWQGDPSYAMWECGEVIHDTDHLIPALDRADDVHPRYLPAQRRFARESLGDIGGGAPDRAVDEILAALH
ncbi:hypothetical protein [Stakelama saccharophila]|uniref:Glycosyl transferase n=1 Tax=Stakelama saccharophila TaxID=3075605 RepID=A0ABZ0B9V7_9SPHN|nr:hypothetical protein [Stakelama sp. W311]WNO54064.1 hypothetical protein RPR59_02050 [Stakelama sp. W311]